MNNLIDRVRIQFDISGDMWRRMVQYAPNPKMRHMVAMDALDEWLTRREGRDTRLRTERLAADVELIRPIIRRLREEERS